MTSRETVEGYLLFRAAELTLQNGYDWFAIVDRHTDAQARTYVEPDPLYHPWYGPGFGYWRPSWRYRGARLRLAQLGPVLRRPFWADRLDVQHHRELRGLRRDHHPQGRQARRRPARLRRPRGGREPEAEDPVPGRPPSSGRLEQVGRAANRARPTQPRPIEPSQKALRRVMIATVQMAMPISSRVAAAGQPVVAVLVRAAGGQQLVALGLVLLGLPS